MLRLDWNLLFTMMNLLLWCALVKHFLFRPVDEILEKRRAEEEKRFAEAAREKEAAKESRARYEQCLAQAEAIRLRALAEGRKQAGEEYEQRMKEAGERAARLEEQARKRSSEERQELLRQADAQLRELVLSAAAKLSGTETAGQDERLLDQFLEETEGAVEDGRTA